MVAPVEGEREAVMRQALGMHAGAAARLLHQPHRAFLQNAGAHTAENVSFGRAIEDNIGDPRFRQQLPEQEPRRPGADDDDLSAHDCPPTSPRKLQLSRRNRTRILTDIVHRRRLGCSALICCMLFSVNRDTIKENMQERAVVADETQAPETKLTSTKRRWAADGKFLTGRIARPETDRLPPGQHLVRDWPVLDLGQQPHLTHETWRLDVTGLVENPLSLDWNAFQALPQSDSLSDIHCVTTWSRYDNNWHGVSTRDLLDRVMPKPEAAYVMLTSFDGYTTNLPLADFAAEDAILATAWEGAPITRAHGGPCAWGPASLFLEKRQMAAAHRFPRGRFGRLLGAERLPHAGRPVAGGALFRRLTLERDEEKCVRFSARNFGKKRVSAIRRKAEML